MTSELDALLLEFPEWTERLREWNSHINNRQFGEIVDALQAQGMNWGEAAKEASDRIRASAPPKPNADAYVGRLCQYFIKAGPEERGKIYLAFEGSIMLLELEVFLGRAINHFQSSKSLAALNYALVAAAIEDGRGVDYRDTALALDRMIESAKRFNVDYKTPITKVLALIDSTPHMRTEFPNAKQILAFRLR